MISVVLPVINETFSLRQTIDALFKLGEVKEILIIIDDKKTTNESKLICNELAKNPKIKVIVQTLPFLGGAIQEGFEKSTQEYTLTMGSDLETDPAFLPEMIKHMTKYDIVTVTRWHKDGKFEGYGKIRLIQNKIFQIMLKMLYRTSLSDLTYGYRILRTDLIKKIKWEELKHPFLLEMILKPLKLGCSIKEVKGSWKKRQEGYSSNRPFTEFMYLKTAVKIRLMSKNNILKQN